MTGTERDRLASVGSFEDGLEAASPWYLWGPYLAERAWGTVREDYGPECSGWNGLTHEQARSKAYRWNEDGLAGISDAQQRLCLSLALWNGVDPILKERAFGLTNDEGNHGEDVKEYWWYRDAVPSSAWLSWRYHYPQAPFPYAWLLDEARERRKVGGVPEPELLDSGAFDGDRFWVVDVDYAKADVDDVLVRIRVTNAGPVTATLHVLPTLWFRNTWSWQPGSARPGIAVDGDSFVTTHDTLPAYRLTAEPDGTAEPDSTTAPTALFCDNDSNDVRLYGTPTGPAFAKDGINDHVVSGAPTVNPQQRGTKAAWWYRLSVAPGQTREVRLRLSAVAGSRQAPSPAATVPFAEVMAVRQAEADEFYAALTPGDSGPDEAAVMRQAFAGLLWSKQYYAYDVNRWLEGDPGQPAPPPRRAVQPPGRNTRWRHLRAADVFVMPDTWEYPWFAGWDLAFHAIVLAHLDPAFAKHQLRLLCLDRYQHPDGALPAYEWEFSDVNPPVHAWAAMKVYRLDGSRDRGFLVDIFDRLRVNLAWWSQREDLNHDHLFAGGFLGLDNVSPFNRSAMPAGITLEQADATAWMAFFCLSMLHIASELAATDPAGESVATGAAGDSAYEAEIVSLLDQFATIGHALNTEGLWDPADAFFLDRVRWPDGRESLIKVHSIVGVVALFAVATVPAGLLAGAPASLTSDDELGFVERDTSTGRGLVTVAGRGHLTTMLREVLDEDGFLSPYGIRSLSRRHLTAPPDPLTYGGEKWSMSYLPAESDNPGVNSNWRGPIWLPVNFLLIEALARIGEYYGDSFRVEFPTGSGRLTNLTDIAVDLRRRIGSLFLPGPDGRRPCYGWVDRFRHDDRWRSMILFFEYFHADNGAGLGASHQTGWTALVADLITGRRLGGEGETW